MVCLVWIAEFERTLLGNVADSTSLLEPRGRGLVSTVAKPHESPAAAAPRRARSRTDLSLMPGLKSFVNKWSNNNNNNGSGGNNHSSATSHTASPLLRRERSCTNLIRPSLSLATLRKSDTVLTFAGIVKAGSSGSIGPVEPINRLRLPPHASSSRICSRCSSVLTLASNSRYSLNRATGCFEPVVETNSFVCKLCLSEVSPQEACSLCNCKCTFCKQVVDYLKCLDCPASEGRCKHVLCMGAYVEFEIAEGAYDISCPDAQCPVQGTLDESEIRDLVGQDLLYKHKKYRLNREVELDKTRTWCPRIGCETVCTLCPVQPCQPQSVHCPTCDVDFCSNCKLEWHPSITCDENTKELAKQGKVEEPGIPFNSDLIKCCPMCNVPIEKDEGCAQMMCKRCKHVFCWYCLTSLDDDFLLRHYDKGPCKNKLGHSRASVIWHRTQVIGIFAGFGILLLVASPLLLLAAPCIVCCKCRFCDAGNSKPYNEEELPEENN